MASHELLTCQSVVCPKGLEAFKNSVLPMETEMLHGQIGSPHGMAL